MQTPEGKARLARWYRPSPAETAPMSEGEKNRARQMIAQVRKGLDTYSHPDSRGMFEKDSDDFKRLGQRLAVDPQAAAELGFRSDGNGGLRYVPTDAPAIGTGEGE